MSARIHNIIGARKGGEVARRLRLLARVFHPLCPESVDEAAQAEGLSRSAAYELIQKSRRLLASRPPGPPPGAFRLALLSGENAELRFRVQALEAENAQLRAQLEHSLHIDEVFICRLILALVVLPVSVHDIRRVFVALIGAKAPSVSAISRRVQRFGTLARQLIDRARREVAHRILSLLSDEIYFKSKPVLITMEPSSRAALDVERTQQVDSETWACVFIQYPNLKRDIADGGTAMAGAARVLKLNSQLELFHELRHHHQHLIKVVEKDAYAAIAYEYKKLDELSQAKTAADKKAAQQRYESARKLALRHMADLARAQHALSLIRQAYEPTTASGRLKTRPEADGSIEQAITLLSAGSHQALHSAARHIEKWRDHYTVYLEAFDDIPVLLTHNSRLTTREVLATASEYLHWQARLFDPAVPWPDYQAWRAARRRASRQFKRLGAACENLQAVLAQLKFKLRLLERSTSPLEALNLLERKLQQLVQTPSDEQVALVVLDYDLKVRDESHPCGATSPFGALGISFARGNPTLVDLLLREAGLIPATALESTPSVPTNDASQKTHEAATTRLVLVHGEASVPRDTASSEPGRPPAKGRLEQQKAA
jgi:hypothetical protein